MISYLRWSFVNLMFYIKPSSLIEIFIILFFFLDKNKYF